MNRRQPRLALMSLPEFVSSSACTRWGDTSWWVVRRRANGEVNTPPLLETQRQPNRTHLLKQTRWISSEAAKGGGKGTR